MTQTQTMPTPSAAPAPPSVRWRSLVQQRRHDELPKNLDVLHEVTAAWLACAAPRRTRYLRCAERILSIGESLVDVDEARLHEDALALRATFRRARETRADLDRAFALVREVALRQVGLAAYREQVAAALAMHAGGIAEVATGEGKTLAATMPAVLAGWRGRGCHVITVNDYLAKRDAEWMAPVYERCGLSVAHIEGEFDGNRRRAAYAADITYCTNKEVCADFLRDTLALGKQVSMPRAMLRRITGGDGHNTPTTREPVMRGLATAIVDEADSVLIDEAVTPLIISGNAPNTEQREAYPQAIEIAGLLQQRRDYRVDHTHREVRLTTAGRRRVAELAPRDSGLWAGARRREEMVAQALTAKELFHNGQHYVVQDGRIVIVDEFTGRLMPDRTWRDGLHQAVEAKEDLEVQPAKVTLARISFQQFFRHYHNLCGMTGTAWETRHELWRVYRTPTTRIPTHMPCIRKHLPDRAFHNEADKWRGVVDEIARIHDSGRPVLVGTRSVEHSERLSALLDERDLEHQVLNAVRHDTEAAVISEAGKRGRITVATNMAGRGTDIQLDEDVRQRGGLHVIACERHEAQRVDRQLFGRAGRQGDPGSAVAMFSLEDELLRRHAPRLAAALGNSQIGRSGKRAGLMVRLAMRYAQRRAERRAKRQRRAVLQRDDWLREHLGFAGSG